MEDESGLLGDALLTDGRGPSRRHQLPPDPAPFHMCGRSCVWQDWGQALPCMLMLDSMLLTDGRHSTCLDGPACGRIFARSCLHGSAGQHVADAWVGPPADAGRRMAPECSTSRSLCDRQTHDDCLPAAKAKQEPAGDQFSLFQGFPCAGMAMRSSIRSMSLGSLRHLSRCASRVGASA